MALTLLFFLIALQLDFVRRDRPNNVLIDLIEKTRKVVRSLDNKGVGRMTNLFKNMSNIGSTEEPIDVGVSTVQPCYNKTLYRRLLLYQTSKLVCDNDKGLGRMGPSR